MAMRWKSQKCRYAGLEEDELLVMCLEIHSVRCMILLSSGFDMNSESASSQEFASNPAPSHHWSNDSFPESVSPKPLY